MTLGADTVTFGSLAPHDRDRTGTSHSSTIPPVIPLMITIHYIVRITLATICTRLFCHLPSEEVSPNSLLSTLHASTFTPMSFSYFTLSTRPAATWVAGNISPQSFCSRSAPCSLLHDRPLTHARSPPNIPSAHISAPPCTRPRSPPPAPTHTAHTARPPRAPQPSATARSPPSRDSADRLPYV